MNDANEMNSEEQFLKFIDGYYPEELIVPMEELKTRIDFVEGLLDGNSYFFINNWHREDLDWAREERKRGKIYSGDIDRINHLLYFLIENIDDIHLLDNSSLIDKRFKKSSSRHVLLEVVDGRLEPPSAVLIALHDRKLIDLNPLFKILQRQWND